MQIKHRGRRVPIHDGKHEVPVDSERLRSCEAGGDAGEGGLQPGTEFVHSELNVLTAGIQGARRAVGRFDTQTVEPVHLGDLVEVDHREDDASLSARAHRTCAHHLANQPEQVGTVTRPLHILRQHRQVDGLVSLGGDPDTLGEQVVTDERLNLRRAGRQLETGVPFAFVGNPAVDGVPSAGRRPPHGLFDDRADAQIARVERREQRAKAVADQEVVEGLPVVAGHRGQVTELRDLPVVLHDPVDELPLARVVTGEVQVLERAEAGDAGELQECTGGRAVGEGEAAGDPRKLSLTLDTIGGLGGEIATYVRHEETLSLR